MSDTITELSAESARPLIPPNSARENIMTEASDFYEQHELGMPGDQMARHVIHSAWMKRADHIDQADIVRGAKRYLLWLLESEVYWEASEDLYWHGGSDDFRLFVDCVRELKEELIELCKAE
jgi:hypothetical protein